jgi:hypothetical protein
MDKGSLIILAIFLIPVIFLLIFLAPIFLGPSEAVENGPLVIGTIVSVKQTGSYFNYNPELEVTIKFTTDNGQQITTSVRKYVNMIDLAHFQIGSRVPVKYNPENPNEIMMAFELDDNTLQFALDKEKSQNNTNEQYRPLIK